MSRRGLAVALGATLLVAVCVAASARYCASEPKQPPVVASPWIIPGFGQPGPTALRPAPDPWEPDFDGWPDPNIPNGECGCDPGSPPNAYGCYVAFCCGVYPDFGAVEPAQRGPEEISSLKVVDADFCGRCDPQPWSETVEVRPVYSATVDYGYDFGKSQRIKGAINRALAEAAQIGAKGPFWLGETNSLLDTTRTEVSCGGEPSRCSHERMVMTVYRSTVTVRLPLRYRWYYQIRCGDKWGAWEPFTKCEQSVAGWATLEGIIDGDKASCVSESIPCDVPCDCPPAERGN